MISRARFNGKTLFRLTWNEGFECSCLWCPHQELLSLLRSICSFRVGGPVLPTSQVLREDLVVCTDLELCAFLHSEDPNDGRNVSAPPDLMVLLQKRYRSCHFLSRPEVENMDLFALPLNVVNWFCTQRTELLVKCFVRDNVVLIFHPFDHCPES